MEARGRENHFHLLRMALALAVLLSHCFPLTQGRHGYAGEPLFVFTGGMRILATTAVLGFFVISGYLVSESLQRAPGLKFYFGARALRIYPAALVCAALCGLVLGPAIADSSAIEYFASRDTYRFLYCTSLFPRLHLADSLPDVFATNPIPRVVNGSIWTIPWELLCYLILVPVGIALYRQPRAWIRAATYGLLLLMALAGAREYALHSIQNGRASGLVVFWGFFCVGILGRAALPSVPDRRWLTLAAMAVLLLCWRLEHHWPALAIGTPFLFGFVLLRAATQLPSAWLAYNKVGDFSYGLYLYAWPIQQTIVHLQPGIGPWLLFALAFPATLALAVASWSWIEKPALRLKKRLGRAKGAAAAQPIAVGPA